MLITQPSELNPTGPGPLRIEDSLIWLGELASKPGYPLASASSDYNMQNSTVSIFNVGTGTQTRVPMLVWQALY